MTTFSDHFTCLPDTLDLTLKSNDWRVPLSCLSSAGYLPRVTVDTPAVAASLGPDPCAPPSRGIGGGSNWLLVLCPLAPGCANVKVTLHRPWLIPDPSALVHTIEVVVHEPA